MAKSISLLFACNLWLIGVIATVSWIVPGAVWLDTDGVEIDAHGGQIWKENSTFYWIGSSYADSFQPRIYTSTDLMNWVNQGVIYPITEMFRPKLFQGTSRYYVLGQVSDEAQQLSSSSIISGWIKGPLSTLPPDSWVYSDEGVFQDDDGKLYFLTSAQSNNLQINSINGTGSIGGRVAVLEDGPYEAPGMFKANGVYYLIVSSKTGYTANPNVVFWANSISGPYNGPGQLAPDSPNTYGSQNSAELVIEGSEVTTYIFLGDAWTVGGTAASTYMWLPILVDTAHTVNLQYEAMWTIDVNTGVVSVPAAGKRYEAEHAEISGRAAVTDCEHCISKRAVHNIDPSSLVVFKEVTGTGNAQWVSFHYTTNQPNDGEAYIYVNDDTKPCKISDYNLRAGYHKTVPIRLILDYGDVNTIKFGCTGSKDFKIHLDGIELHED